jgi:peptidoglycan-associated lipoprotein
MRLKFLALLAAAVLVAGCSSTPEQSSTAGGTGGSAGSSTSTPSTAAQPAGPRPGSQEELVATVGDRVFFDYDKSSVKPDGRTVLNRQAAWLKQYGSVSVTVEGHCDERGTREFNLALGERRANAVKDYLVSQGISASRIKTISYGKERPVALGSNEAAWSQNRRGVTVVSTPGS